MAVSKLRHGIVRQLRPLLPANRKYFTVSGLRYPAAKVIDVTELVSSGPRHLFAAASQNFRKPTVRWYCRLLFLLRYT